MAEHPPRSGRRRGDDEDFPVAENRRENSLSKKEKKSARRMKRSAGEAVGEIPVILTHLPKEEFDDVAVTNEIRDLLFKAGLSKDAGDEPIIEQPIPHDSADAIDQGHVQEVFTRSEKTPLELRKKLRELIIGGAKGMTEGVSERFSKSKNYLNERAKQIDASASEMGGIEKLFRRMGENYNKLSLVHKLGVGLTLGAGAVISVASFAPLMALGFGTALGAQRAFGLGSMFVSQEKALQAKRVGESEQLISVKERAMLNAMLYTLGMSFAIKEGIELANEYGVVERTREWLGGMLGHNTVMSETAVPASAVAAAPEVVTPVMPEVSEPAAAAAAGEPVLAPTIDSVVPADSVAELPAAVPDVSVDAVKGRGYEYMMKRMWEQLQDKGLDASQYAQDSDIHKLLTATPEDIDTVVHQIASDPEHNFYRPDGTSVRIDMDSKMTLNADGTIQLGDTVKAPENVPITPAQYPETPAPNVEESVASAAPLPPPADTDTVLTPPVEEQQSFTPLTHDSDIQSPAPVTDHSFVVNRYGLNIPVAEPHIYGDAGAKHLFVYGGTPVERATAILHYLEKNPNGIIFDADNSEKYRIPWHLVDGKVIPDFPARTGGFLGFFSTWMKPPGPDDLRQLIK